jgi:prepilin-type processing-associated H-X9-DG protein
VAISIKCECGRRVEAPESIAGALVRCPDCAREQVVPKPSLPAEFLIDSWEWEKTATSGKAIASFVLGILFFFACFTGLPAILFGMLALAEIRLSKGRLRGKRMAVTGIFLGVIGCLFSVALVLPAMRSAGNGGNRAHCTINLRSIGLAMHNYHELNGCLPPAAITDKNGRPLLSWRVALLPYIEANNTYVKFHLDEPWDSPHNLALLEAMPTVYACPSDRTLTPGMTGYQVVIGSNTVFTPDFKSVTFHGITDGLHNTLLVGESQRNVPWTKPEDLRDALPLPLNGLGSHHGDHNNGFHALMVDGSVRFLKSTIAPSVLRALVTRNGEEVVSSDT